MRGPNQSFFILEILLLSSHVFVDVWFVVTNIITGKYISSSKGSEDSAGGSSATTRGSASCAATAGGGMSSCCGGEAGAG